MKKSDIIFSSKRQEKRTPKQIAFGILNAVFSLYIAIVLISLAFEYTFIQAITLKIFR